MRDSTRPHRRGHSTLAAIMRRQSSRGRAENSCLQEEGAAAHEGRGALHVRKARVRLAAAATRGGCARCATLVAELSDTRLNQVIQRGFVRLRRRVRSIARRVCRRGAAHAAHAR
jgi:hypothetical protein